MFGPPGVAYVYLVYGMHECLNVVCEVDGRAAAVLIRAVEPVSGHAGMRGARTVVAERRAGTADARRRAERRLATLPTARIAAGPGLVTEAFDVGRSMTGLDLLDPRSPLRLEVGDPVAGVVATPRIGVGYAPAPWRDLPWRLLDPSSPSISIPPANPRA